MKIFRHEIDDSVMTVGRSAQEVEDQAGSEQMPIDHSTYKMIEEMVTNAVEMRSSRFVTWRQTVTITIGIFGVLFGVFQYHVSTPHDGAVTDDRFLASINKLSQSIDKLSENAQENSKSVERLTAYVELLLGDRIAEPKD